MSRLVFDAGALIALDRGQRAMWRRLELARRDRSQLVTHAAVLGQVWRNARQVRLARALLMLDIQAIDRELGRRAGELLAAARMDDVVDATLVLLSRDGDRILTSDPDDILALARAAGRDIVIVEV